MSAPNDIVVRLREEGFITHMAKLPRESKILHAAADEIERLRAERDHLRRLYCEYQASTIVGRTPQRQAENLEWDCFKETE